LILQSLAAGLLLLSATLPASEGIIEGVVRNGSRHHVAAAGLEIVLRAPIDGEFVVVAQTTTAADGTFRFDQLPVEAPGPFLPGANLAEIHFPGPRVTLSPAQPNASVTLTVFESAAAPNPLVVDDHRIVVEAQPGAIRVRETLQINNRSSLCYVGVPRHEGGGPVTLELGIPQEFERVTFDKEGFGRQFRVINGKLVTGIPWPPGRRELGFSYLISNQQGNRVWQRRIDLPSQRVHVTVQGTAPQNVVCSLPATANSQAGEDELCFAATGSVVPAGELVRLELDHLPVPAMVNARWVALGVLLALTGGVVVASRRRGDHASMVAKGE
jgi:hypothetical protein